MIRVNRLKIVEMACLDNLKKSVFKLIQFNRILFYSKKTCFLSYPAQHIHIQGRLHKGIFGCNVSQKLGDTSLSTRVQAHAYQSGRTKKGERSWRATSVDCGVWGRIRLSMVCPLSRWCISGGQRCGTSNAIETIGLRVARPVMGTLTVFHTDIVIAAIHSMRSRTCS